MGHPVHTMPPDVRARIWLGIATKAARAKRFTGRAAQAKAKARAIRAEAKRPPIVMTFRLPVSVNALYKRTRRGVYLNPDAVAFKEMVAMECVAAGVVPFIGPVKVTTVYYNSRADADNRAKLLFDSLQGFAYVNDRQVKESKTVMAEDDDTPRVRVFVESAP